MADISDLQKKLRLESELSQVRRELAGTEDVAERKALKLVLAKILKEINDFSIDSPEVAVVAHQGPALPDPVYQEPLPSVRARFSSPRDEGARRRRR